MGISVGDAVLKLGLDTTALDRGLQGIQGKLQGAGKKLTGIGKSMSMKVTAPIVGAGIAAFKFAGDFDQAMRQTNVMLGASGDEFANYKKQVLAISSATGKSANDVAAAFYQIVSAGYRGSDAIDILNVAMKGAVGGAADAEQTTAALTKAMNIFQLQGVEGSTRAMDTFFGIVDSGLLTFEEMASSFPRAATMAAGLGVSIEETGAALATLSKVSGSTEQASTALNAVFTQLMKPSSDLQALYEEWGIKSGPEAIEKFGGLEGVLTKVTEATHGDSAAMSKLFPNVEAIRAVLPLTTTNADDFTEALKTVGGASGRTGKAFEEMAQGPGFQMNQLLTSLKNSSIVLGDAIANTLGPYLEKLVGWLQKATDWFSKLPDPAKKMIIIIAGIAAAIGPVLMMLGMMLPAIGAITTALKLQTIAMVAHKVALIASKVAMGIATAAQWLLNVAMSANPIGLIILAIVAVIAIIVLLVKKFDWVKEKAIKIWNAIAGFFGKIGGAIKNVLINMTPVGLIIKHWGTIKKKASEIWGKVTGFFGGVKDKVKGHMTDMAESVKKKVTDAWRKTRDNAKEIANKFNIDTSTTTGKVAATVLGMGKTIYDKLPGPIQGAVRSVLGHFKGLWEGAKEKVGWVKDKFQDLIDFFKELPERVGRIFSDVWNAMKTGIKSSLNWIIDKLNWLIGKLNWIPRHLPGEFWPEIPEIPRLARGGIVTEPTLALLGERGPEAVVPLSSASAGIVNNFHIGELVVREEADIQRIARELYRLQQSKSVLAGV